MSAPGLALMLLLTAVACGGPQASRAAVTPTAPAVSASAPPAVSPATAPATATPASLPDFPLVAYQGDATFGGHDGHLAAVFGEGHPVVLLFWAGL